MANGDTREKIELTRENVKRFTDNLGLFDCYLPKSPIQEALDQQLLDWGSKQQSNTSAEKFVKIIQCKTSENTDISWRYSTIKTSPSASGTILIRRRAPCYTNRESYPPEHKNCVMGPVEQWMDFSWGSSGHIERWLSQIQPGYVPEEEYGFGDVSREEEEEQDEDVIGTIPSPNTIRRDRWSNIVKSRQSCQNSSVWQQISRSRGKGRARTTRSNSKDEPTGHCN